MPGYHGYYEKPSSTAFTLNNYFSRNYQDSTEKNIKYKFGLFPGFTRIHRQIEYSFFNKIHVQDVYKGENGYLFRYSLTSITDKKFEPSALDHYLETYSKLSDSLKAAGKNIVWIIAPDKNIVFSEYLSVPHPAEINGYYWSFKTAIKKKKLPVIDFNELAYREKNRYPFAVSGKGGVHWTQPYAARCFDSLCNYLSAHTSISINNTINYKRTKNPWDPDYDIEQSANLLIPLEGKENCYFADIVSKTNAKNKKALLVGDSFCHAWLWNNWMKNPFGPGSEFWYYNREREAYSFGNTFIKKLDHKNVRDYIRNFDTFIIVFSAANMEMLDYGFINDITK
jgi:hypothetical protein